MQAQNIAIVFGPTLMWPEIEAPNLAITMAYQNRIVEFLLLEYENIFWWNDWTQYNNADEWRSHEQCIMGLNQMPLFVVSLSPLVCKSYTW